MPDRFTVGAVWMRAVAGVVGYDGPLSKTLGFAYSFAVRRHAAYDQHAHGELRFAGLRFREVGAGSLVVCGRRFEPAHYDREVKGGFLDERLHERAYCAALELLEPLDVELLDTTDAAWRGYMKACDKHDVLARFLAAGKVISLR